MTSLDAKFEYQADGKTYYENKRVVDWEDGEGLVVSNGKLCVASGFANFAGYCERTTYVGVLPSIAGTVAVMKDGGRIPVVGYVVDEDGWGTALTLNGDGVIDPHQSGIDHFDHPDFSE